MADVHVHSPAGSFASGYFGHSTHDSLYRPPAPSRKSRQALTPSYHRSHSGRSTSSIPRPVSRSNADGGTVRKRPRLDNQSYSLSKSFVSSATSTPQAETPASQQAHRLCGLDGESEYDFSYFSVAGSARSRDALSPPPFVNTSYKLAGGLDTPGASFDMRQEEWADRQEQLDWRVNRYTQKNGMSDVAGEQNVAQSRNILLRTPSSISGYGQKRSLDDSPQFETPPESSIPSDVAYSVSGWHIRSRAWAVTGGLAFKAINFCWNTAFKGFSAGGGQAYDMDLGTPEVPHHGFRVSQVAPSEDVFSNQYEKPDEVPGGFPEDGFTENYLCKDNPDTSTPTLKRNHDDPGSELRNDWLMVDRPNLPRRRSRASIAGSRNNLSRQASSAGAGTGNGVTPTGASFASPRSRPSLGHHRRTSNHSTRTSPERRRPSLTINQQYLKDISMQTTPVHRRSIHSPTPSTMSPEVIKFEKRLRKKARQEDESMTRMNAHLQDLIRQGKEALGSKVSIEDDVDDEGFYEDGSADEQYHHLTTREAW